TRRPPPSHSTVSGSRRRTASPRARATSSSSAEAAAAAADGATCAAGGGASSVSRSCRPSGSLTGPGPPWLSRVVPSDVEAATPGGLDRFGHGLHHRRAGRAVEGQPDHHAYGSGGAVD